MVVEAEAVVKRGCGNPSYSTFHCELADSQIEFIVQM